jgi:glycosyltransferase involved in cell wall biosynthesis/GT2 family glycosyltransferase
VYEWGWGRESFSEKYHMTEVHPLACESSRGRLLNCWMPYWDLSRPILADKSPHHIMRTRWLQKLFPEAVFAFIVRNALVRATGEALQDGSSPMERCREWTEAYMIMEGDIGSLHEYLILRYEDLVHFPEETMGRLCHFLSIPHMDVRGREFFVHSFPNGIMRPDRNPIRDMNLPHILNFLESFDINTRREMLEICRPLLGRFGYSTDMESYERYTEDSDIRHMCAPLSEVEKKSPYKWSKKDPHGKVIIDTSRGKNPSPIKMSKEYEKGRDLPIAIVTETLDYISGGVRCIVEVLNRLRQRGYETFCFVTHSSLECNWLDVNFPIRPLSEFEDFDGIAISPYSVTAEIVEGSRARGKFYWVHTYEPAFADIMPRRSDWRELSERSYRLSGIHYMAASTYVRMILKHIYGREVLTTLVPGGVDCALFRPGQKGASIPRVVFLNREHGFRGMEDVLSALEKVKERGLSFEALALGEPLQSHSLKVRSVPWLSQQDYAAVLSTADIFVHASHFEGLPLPPLEAMACKCAVVSTYVGASDYLLDGYNALVVPPGRPDHIAHALERLIEDEEFRRRLAEGGYETVLSGYTWEHTVDRLEEALREGMAVTGERTSSTLDTGKAHLGIHSTESFTYEKSTNSGEPLVSAIVSTYNAERFIRGCLEDLESQTIARRLEIIVVDSGSQQNERAIVEEFQGRYDNIRYIRTDKRESVYAAWNRAIKTARGKYITNANTDDRRRRDALEILARTLDENPDVALVYGDFLVTENENETFDQCNPVGHVQVPEFDPVLLASVCYVGPQPMWRRELHEKHGYFDETFECAGDYEFWLRMAKSGEKFLHVPQTLGLYLKRRDSLENSDFNRALRESNEARMRHFPQLGPLVLKKEGLGRQEREKEQRIPSGEDALAPSTVAPGVPKSGLHEEALEWGEHLAILGCIKEAKETFWSLLEVDPRNWRAKNDLACLLWHEGEVEGALLQLIGALEENPRQETLLLNCLDVLKALGRESDCGPLMSMLAEVEKSRA